MTVPTRAKMEIAEVYRARYSKRPAFKTELRAFGMKDRRK